MSLVRVLVFWDVDVEGDLFKVVTCENLLAIFDHFTDFIGSADNLLREGGVYDDLTNFAEADVFEVSGGDIADTWIAGAVDDVTSDEAA